MTSTQLFINPNYNNANLSNDVSLIKLPTALTFSKTIQPISLVPFSQSNNDFQGTTAIIAGFGLIDDEYLGYSQYLLYAKVDFIDNSECVAVFVNEVVNSSNLCGKGVNGSKQSICSGDSGGPLIAQDSNGKFMQIGINLFVVKDMGTEGYPSSYVRLPSFLDYISETTGMQLS